MTCQRQDTDTLNAVGLVAVMDAPRARVQDAKPIVKQLEEDGRHEPLAHRKVYRPSCSYDSIDMGADPTARILR